jgi:D-alanine-D-alanine ligase
MSHNSGMLTVAVIMGGTSSEREVSLNSGNAVIKALDKSKYHIRTFDPKDDLVRLAKDANEIDVALIMIHGRGGEDGTLQGMLELLGVPYQGSGVLGSALAMDKPVSKDLYRAAGLPVAPDLLLRVKDNDPTARVLSELGLPAVVKPDCGGSSCGVTIVREPGKLAEAIGDAFALDNQVLVEKYLEGREITCGVLGNSQLEALPLVEIIPNRELYDFFDYEAKYKSGASQEICPARLDQETTIKVQQMALTAHRALHLRGYSRSDFILTGEGPVILETNTIPGMTATSLLPQEALASGLDFTALLDRLIELAME